MGPTSVTRAGAATAYAWNERGDLLDDGTQAYAWDAAGRLVGVSVTGGPEVAYLYDGRNDRIAMVVDGVTTTYVVDPYNPVDYLPQVLVEETGGTAMRNFYGLDLLAQAGSTTTTHLAYDALSVRLRLDEDGAPADAYRYGPFGEAMGEAPIGYGFAGERWDEPVGLVYLRARYYAPEGGRFVSRDPLQTGAVGALHPYVYAANQPVVLVDPHGMAPFPPYLPPSMFDLLHDILVPGFVDGAEEVTPPGLRRFPIRIFNVTHINILCLDDYSVFQWTEEELVRFERVTDELRGRLGEISGFWGDYKLYYMVYPAYWHIFRSQWFNPRRGEGQRGGGGSTVPQTKAFLPRFYPQQALTVFYGTGAAGWADAYEGRDAETQARAFVYHEFGHVWDYLAQRSNVHLPGYFEEHQYPPSPDKPWAPEEAWAQKFTEVILREDESSHWAQYVISEIRWWPWKPCLP